MLKMEYLLEEARGLGLPLKKRAILREYLQGIILNSICRSNFSKSMFFVGGTALRFFYNLPRFSDDLDFNTPSLSEDSFKELLARVEMDLSLEGFSPAISHKTRNGLFIASVNIAQVMGEYGIIDGRGGDIMIKIEVNQPKWPLPVESHVLSLYGYSFSAILMSKGALFSEKLSALLSKRRGRYIYDILFMLRRGFPFDREILSANNIPEEPGTLILNYLSEIPEKELKRLAEQLKPFLFREDDIELVLKAPVYAEKFLSRYQAGV